ncbi:MAG: hypothetical protein GX853_07800 [Chloroflexi bacterium]|jgi:hypothetical protein|nr:hypothetical protein [Chloroflexota bacterium]
MSDEKTEIPNDFNELMRDDSEETHLEVSEADAHQDWQDEDPVLRCNRCGKPIDAQHAILTPIGYRCKECVRGQQKVFDTSKALDPVIAFFIAALVAFAGSWLVAPLGFIIILVASGLGLLIYNLTRLALKRRRGTKIDLAILFGALIGASPLLLRLVLQMVNAKSINVGGGVGKLIWYIVYVALVASSAYAQSRGARK